MRVKAVKVGSENSDKPKPIQVSFSPLRQEISSVGRRTNPWSLLYIQIKKCLPQHYRQKKRISDTGSLGKQTRVVIEGHKLVLEFKQHDDQKVQVLDNPAQVQQQGGNHSSVEGAGDLQKAPLHQGDQGEDHPAHHKVFFLQQREDCHPV